MLHRWQRSATACGNNVQQKLTRTMYMPLEVYSAPLLTRFIDHSKTQDRPFVRILPLRNFQHLMLFH